MSAELLMTQADIDEHPDDWHKARSATIGASEIAVLLGLAPKSHGTPFSLYVEKKTGQQVIDNDGDDETERGLVLEPYVAGQLAKMRPDLAVLPGGMYRDATFPWMTATFDRFTVSREAAGDRLPLFGTTLPDRDHADLRKLMIPAEIKTCVANDYAAPEYQWGEPYTDQVPVNYKTQAYWQLAIWGSDRLLLPVQFMQPWRTALYVINRTDEVESDIAFMIRRAVEFRDRLDNDDPPDIDWARKTAAALRTLHPMREDAVYRASATQAKRLRAAYKRMKSTEARYRLLQNQLIARAAGAQRIVIADPERDDKDVNVMSRSQYPLPTIADGRLREEMPDIAAKYTQVTPVDKWTPGRRWMNLTDAPRVADTTGEH